MSEARPTIHVTQIGEYIRHRTCGRRFKLDFNDRELADRLPFFFQVSSAMDPVLTEAGRRREHEWEQEIHDAGLIDLCRYDERPDDEATTWQVFAHRARELSRGTAAYGREIEVIGNIGAFRVVGRIDFALVLWSANGLRLRPVECKASRLDRTYHRVQVATYRILLRQVIAMSPLTIGGVSLSASDIDCVVARIDEQTNLAAPILALDPLDLELEEADVTRLLAPGGELTRILATELEALPYQIDTRCANCALSTYCLPESARLRRVELLGIDASMVRALRTIGIRTIDELAELDPEGPLGAQMRGALGSEGSMQTLIYRARARRRTLPGGGAGPSDPEVLPLPRAGQGQLPEHQIDGMRLIRVFVSVTYDYVENRVGAIAAHVTRSDRPLSTLFRPVNGKWQPDPDLREQWHVGVGPDGRKIFNDRPVRGEDVVGIIREPWTGDYAEDTCREARLLNGFFQRIVQAIQQLCSEEWAPIHFYFWSRGEVSRLVEACSRCGGDLLGHLRELLGCRESLEQLIYSALQEEVENRYVLGWTSRGLVVVTSLKWFGRRFHWTRWINNEVVALDRVFAQDLFGFRTELRFRGGEPGQPWRPLDDPEADRHPFEVRALMDDTLPAPYLRALWGTLPDPEVLPASERPDPKLAQALRRYREAGRPGYLRAYLAGRVQALRWIEEGIRCKNSEIRKPALCIADLHHFTLGVDSAARAALDFLWLEQRVRANNWIADHLVPPLQRTIEGRTLPLRDVRPIAKNRLEGRIDLTGYGVDLATLADRCTFQSGDVVRLSRAAADPMQGQTVGQLLGGCTCRIEYLHWQSGRISLSVLPKPGNRYMLRSLAWSTKFPGFEFATLDDSPSDFVGDKVDRRLQSGLGSHVYRWFDPVQAAIPPQTPLRTEEVDRLREFLSTLDLGTGPLDPDQIHAATDGLSTRMQLIQGPPGTGKSRTAAVATHLRILVRRRAGDVILVVANTHTAVNLLLTCIAAVMPRFRAHAEAGGLSMPPVRLARILSGEAKEPVADTVTDLDAGACAEEVDALGDGAVLVIGGTPNAILKMAEKLEEQDPNRPRTFQANELVLDEASMLIFPHFLALASLLREDGYVLSAGDHRQLDPIVAHDWKREDRPPAILYQPFVSAYVALNNIKRGQSLPDSQILRSALRFTFRLPAAIRELLSRLYRQDGIELDGDPAAVSPGDASSDDPWERLWARGGGLFLVTHDERESKRSNEVEAAIIQEILSAGRSLGRLEPGSVGLVMPHRAQRSLLRSRLTSFLDAVSIIDTVERLQGGERETVIFSATASDPEAISTRADFILNLNRTNVAFSRARRRLIVVCSETLLACIPPELEHYSTALLWKSLRSLCTAKIAAVRVGEHEAGVWTTVP